MKFIIIACTLSVFVGYNLGINLIQDSNIRSVRENYLIRMQVEAVVDSIIDAREILVHYDNERLRAMESALQYHNYLHYKREHNVFVRMNLNEYNEYFKTMEMWQ